MYLYTTFSLSIHSLIDTELLPPFNYCEQCCYEHGGASCLVILSHSFTSLYGGAGGAQRHRGRKSEP